jgi:23S rRNA (uracil1939-C5)-methyltransferase
MEGPFGSGQEMSNRSLSMTISGDSPLTLFWEAGGFCQVNTKQNYNLINLVVECSEPSPSDRLLDLYCGMGNFALPLAKKTGHVHGIESQGAAIRSGRWNSEFNGLSNIRFEKSEVAEACRKLVGAGDSFDTIVCDPPRQGMVNMAPLLARLCRKRVVYVSCDPATLCRDLASLQQQGFSVKKIQPVDMFPQTHHIETVTVLEKNSH